MMSMENSMHRMLSNSEDTRRLLYLHNLHRPSISAAREEPHTVRSLNMTGHQPQQQHIQRVSNLTPNKRVNFGQTISAATTPAPNSSVSRRNARERKRVRLVNQGFSNLRERVPPGTKNKKLSKVETLRAAIEYIRELQQMLGMEDQQTYDFEAMMADENYGPDDCSSVASSEEVRGSCGPSGGSADLSPASSHPSECSLVPSPYPNQHTQDDQLLDIGLWFS